jgi:hypothetical protein
MALLDTCPVINKCLSKSVNQPSDFEGLFDASGALWPENMRNQVEAMFSNSNPAEIFAATAEHFKKCPSAATVFMFAVFTGPNVPSKPPADTAFSMTGKLYGGPWTMWKDQSEDSGQFKMAQRNAHSAQAIYGRSLCGRIRHCCLPRARQFMPFQKPTGSVWLSCARSMTPQESSLTSLMD